MRQKRDLVTLRNSTERDDGANMQTTIRLKALDAFFLRQSASAVCCGGASTFLSHLARTTILLPKALRGTWLLARRGLRDGEQFEGRGSWLGVQSRADAYRSPGCRVFLTARLLFLPSAFTLGWPKLWFRRDARPTPTDKRPGRTRQRIKPRSIL